MQRSVGDVIALAVLSLLVTSGGTLACGNTRVIAPEDGDESPDCLSGEKAADAPRAFGRPGRQVYGGC